MTRAVPLSHPAEDEAFELDENWVPVDLLFDHTPPLVEWWRMGDRRFTEPFAMETLKQYAASSVLLRGYTPCSEVQHVAERYRCLAPSGFIIHLSRCGSTLITRALASDPANRVFSEPRVVGRVLAAKHHIPELSLEAWADWLRWIVAALGRPMAGESRYFIKFSSGAIALLPLLRRSFPETPMLFVIRDPVEVLASHLRKPAAFMLREFPAEMVGLPPEETQFNDADHVSRVIASFTIGMLRAWSGPERGPAMLVDYTELPNAIGEKIYPFFGLPYADEDARRLAPLLRQHSKFPRRRFRADGANKRRRVSEEIRRAAERWAMPAYRALLEARDRMHESPPRLGRRNQWKRHRPQ